MKALLPSWIVVLPLASLLGCATDRERETRSDAVSAYTLSEAPLLSIGGEDDRREYILAQTVRALRLSDGQIVVADASSLDLKYYDESGVFVRQVGGAGEGPGEFARLTNVGRVASDTIAVWDLRLKRLTLFPPDSESSVSVFSFSRPSDMPQRDDRFYLIRDYEAFPLLAGGRMATIAMSEPITQALPSAPIVLQDTVSITLADRNGEGTVEIGPFPGYQWYFFERRGRIIPSGYSERIRAAAGDSVVYAASTHDSDIRIFSAASGDLLASIPLPAPRALLPEDREQVRARFLPGDTEEAFESMPLPATVPTFSELLVSADGRLWVELFHPPNAPERDWMIFDPSGQLQGTLRIDGARELMDAGSDYVVLMATDDLGRQSVQMYGLREVAP